MNHSDVGITNTFQAFVHRGPSGVQTRGAGLVGEAPFCTRNPTRPGKVNRLLFSSLNVQSLRILWPPCVLSSPELVKGRGQLYFPNPKLGFLSSESRQSQVHRQMPPRHCRPWHESQGGLFILLSKNKIYFHQGLGKHS